MITFNKAFGYIFLIFVSLVVQAEVLVEYQGIKVTTDDIEARLASYEPVKKRGMLGRRDVLNRVVEGILYDKVAAKKSNAKSYDEAEYADLIDYLKKKYDLNSEVQKIKEVENAFSGMGLIKTYELEKANWLARQWISEKLSKSLNNAKIEKLALENYLANGGDEAMWHINKKPWVEKARNDFVKRKRLQIWSELVDRSKIKTYPENFEAFLKQHAPQPAPVEGSLPQKP